MYIYKIYCKDSNIKNIYIGSTIDIIKRISLHKHNSKHSLLPLYRFIRNNNGFDNFDVEILCVITDKLNLKKIERFYCELYNNDLLLNIRKSYTSDQEKQIYYKQYTSMYNQQNKQYFKTYYLNNKEKYNRKN